MGHKGRIILVTHSIDAAADPFAARLSPMHYIPRHLFDAQVMRWQASRLSNTAGIAAKAGLPGRHRLPPQQPLHLYCAQMCDALVMLRAKTHNTPHFHNLLLIQMVQHPLFHYTVLYCYTSTVIPFRGRRLIVCVQVWLCVHLCGFF